MSDVMIDIETLGTEPGAAVASIGAVRFSVEDGVRAEFFESISLADCQARGLKIDADTLSWWLNQPAAAREQLHGGRDLDSVLRRLSEFVNDAESIWANSPAFDCVILRDAYRAVGREAPWNYYHERDYRTLREELDDWPDREQETTDHNGLADARFQAECLVEALRGDSDE